MASSVNTTEHRREWHAAHPERDRETHRRWRQAHPEKVAERSRRYRSGWTPAQWTLSIAKITAWNAANPQRMDENSWRGNLRRRYGITATRYYEMLEEQGGVCAVCREPETSLRANGKPKRLAVDHCHKTGQIRGLLCMRCNHTLGRHGDDPNHLEALAAYVRRWEGVL